MINKQNLGSQTAKNGFKNEREIAEKFNDWVADTEARLWLEAMDYNLEKIEEVKAIIISGHKADVQVQVSIKLKEAIDLENLQVKLVRNLKGFNQIDKRWANQYAKLWNIPNNILELIKLYAGELLPTIENPRDKRRMFIDEFSESEQKELVSWLKANKFMIVSDIIKGRGEFVAEWMLVAQKIEENSRWTLKPINFCLNHFGNGEVVITKQGNIKIGHITMQRKGGDGGRKTAQMLQFKINPAELFDV